MPVRSLASARSQSLDKSNSVAASVKLPTMSIIIPNFNGKQFLAKCLSSIFQMNYPSASYEVILVDNRSTDESKEYVEARFPQVKILALDKNYGFAGGDNRGAKVAKGEILVFLNNDATVDKNWLCEIAKVMLQNPKIGICGSKIVLMKKPNNTQYSGGYLNLLGGSVFSPFHGDNPKQNYYFVGAICGASFGARKEVFEKIGGFDEDFFMYAEEGDLCMRAWIQGYPVAYAPHSIMYHFSSGTASSQNEVKRQYNDDVLHARLTSPTNAYYGNRNSIMMLIKNFQAKNIAIGVFFSYFLLLLQLFFVLRKKSTNYIKLLLKAGAWPLKNLKTIWTKRIAVQSNRKVNDAWLIRNNLLLSMGSAFKLVLRLRRDSDGSGEINLE
jgi:GT2 family glycosyltransferase